jgi:hypothetical protein
MEMDGLTRVNYNARNGCSVATYPFCGTVHYPTKDDERKVGIDERGVYQRYRHRAQ